MKLKNRTHALLLLISMMAIQPCYAQKGAPPPKPDGKPGRILLKGGIDTFTAMCGTAGLALTSRDMPAKVAAVKLGSPAYHTGVEQDDIIRSMDVKDNLLRATIERNGKRLQFDIPLNATAMSKMMMTSIEDSNAVLKAGSAKFDTTPRQNLLAGRIKKEEATKLLKEFDIIFVLDVSGSMMMRLPEVHDSKLNWMVAQLTTFAEENKLKNPVIVVTFNNSYEMRSMTPQQFPGYLSTLAPRGGTNIAEPLDAAIDYALGQAKRNLIVLITDGGDSMPQSTTQTVIDASARVKAKGNLVISVMEIGDMHSRGGGKSLIRTLDEDLVSKGASYDMVDAKYYGEIVKYGLDRCMAEAILRARGAK